MNEDTVQCLPREEFAVYNRFGSDRKRNSSPFGNGMYHSIFDSTLIAPGVLA